jgi:hypothetical protein
MIGSSLWAVVNFANLESQNTIDVSINRLNGAIDIFPSWEVLNNVEGIAGPTAKDFIQQNWLRDIQGNSNDFVLKWAGYGPIVKSHTHSDSWTTIVSTEHNHVASHPGWSGNVHNGFLYYYRMESSHFAVIRLSGIWWYANGNEFNSQIDNIVTITCLEDQKSSASSFANIHQITKDAFRVEVHSWHPPYLEVYGGTNFRVPFGYNDVKAANNVEYKATFDNKLYHNTQVLHSNRVSVNIKPGLPTDTRTWDKILFNYDAAATLIGSKLRMYKCEETLREIDCLMTGEEIDLHDKATGEDFVLHKDIFSGYKTIAAAATHGRGGLRQNGETRVYITTPNGGTMTKKLDYYAESIAFSMDNSNNLYVAFAIYTENITESYVEVWRRELLKPDSWDKINTITHNSLDATDDYDFCPGQIHFDPSNPKLLHILSHCGVKGNKITRDKIYSQIVGDSGTIHGHGIVVPFEITSGSEFDDHAIPSFCPFEDNFVIYSFRSNTILSIDKKPTISSYTIPLSNWQLSNFDNFDCMSRIGMFALSTAQVHQGDVKFHYGLFYGNQEYNADKYVNTLLTDLDYEDWKMARSFPLKDMVMTVGF